MIPVFTTQTVNRNEVSTGSGSDRVSVANKPRCDESVTRSLPLPVLTSCLELGHYQQYRNLAKRSRLTVSSAVPNIAIRNIVLSFLKAADIPVEWPTTVHARFSLKVPWADPIFRKE